MKNIVVAFLTFALVLCAGDGFAGFRSSLQGVDPNQWCTYTVKDPVTGVAKTVTRQLRKEDVDPNTGTLKDGIQTVAQAEAAAEQKEIQEEIAEIQASIEAGGAPSEDQQELLEALGQQAEEVAAEVATADESVDEAVEFAKSNDDAKSEDLAYIDETIDDLGDDALVVSELNAPKV